MEVKEIIQDKLDARKKLVTFSREELMGLSRNPEEFDKFIEAYSMSMTHVYACYAYRYNDIIRDMIKVNQDRVFNDYPLINNVYHIERSLDSFGKLSYYDQDDFSGQFEAIETRALGIDTFGMSLASFEKEAASVFEKMTDMKFEEVQTEKSYIGVVNYLAKYHADYLSNSYMLPSILSSLSHVDKDSFADKKEYKTFKKAANRTLTNVEKACRKVRKERAKVLAKDNIHHGYKY